MPQICTIDNEGIVAAISSGYTPTPFLNGGEYQLNSLRLCVEPAQHKQENHLDNQLKTPHSCHLTIEKLRNHRMNSNAISLYLCYIL